MSGKRAVWPVVLASAVGIAILCSLGTWQLRRLEWKEDLLAAIAAKSVEEPTSLAEVLARFQQCGDVNFTRVRLGGHFLDGQEKLVVTAFEGGAGYEVVAPLVTPDNFLVLVDRGIIPETMESEAGGAGYNPMGPVELVAAVRLRSARPGYFDPGNDASANRWYWWDVPAMLATTKLPEGAKPVPFVVQAEAEDMARYPRPQPIDANLANNHLNYAVTWFSLAFVLAVMSCLFIRQQMKKSSA